jgi:IclR family mhp operon transcriptional activator
MPDSNSIRSLVRGLEVLREVSHARGVRAAEIARTLNIPRPTVYRLLETLEHLGYVSRSATDNRFRVTLKTRTIADGYDPETQIGEIAGPVLSRLGRELVWPIDISTHEDAAMVVRETTHGRSPMSIDRNMIGRRLPMLRTASGRAWLAFSQTSERDVCIQTIRNRDDSADRPFLEPTNLNAMLGLCREKGFGMRLGESFIPKTSSFAIPVRHLGTVRACVTVIWITSALSPTRAERELVAPLVDAAAEIEARLLAET